MNDGQDAPVSWPWPDDVNVDCLADVGQPCVNRYTGRPLEHWPAHTRRERP